MKKLLLVIPFLALASCEGSIASAVGDAGKSSFSGGTAIPSADTNPGTFQGVTLAGLIMSSLPLAQNFQSGRKAMLMHWNSYATKLPMVS